MFVVLDFYVASLNDIFSVFVVLDSTILKTIVTCVVPHPPPRQYDK